MVNSFVSVSTDAVNQAEVIEYWSDQVKEIYGGIASDFRFTSNRFDASFERANFGGGKIAVFQAGPHEGDRLERHIAKDGVNLFYVALIRKGIGSFSYKNKEIYWQEGDVFSGTIGDPFHFQLGSDVEFTQIFFDIAWVRSFLPVPEDLLVCELSRTSGWGKALAAIMRELAPRTVNRLILPSSVIAEQIGGLLALSLGPDVECLRSSRGSLLRRLRGAMQDRLFDASLGPAQFAREHGISVRTLHNLFSAVGTSFMAELISMRLDRAKSLLEDRRFDGKTIIEIALLVGFINADHFSARFRKAFGVSPTAYRARRQEKRVQISMS